MSFDPRRRPAWLLRTGLGRESTTDNSVAYGESTNQSGIYGTIAVIFLFQGFYAFSITPMTSLYPTEVSQYKLRATGIAIFRMLDSGFGQVFYAVRLETVC